MPARVRSAPKGTFGAAYETITSPENAAVVRSVAVFGAAVAFLSSPWAEFLLPPYVFSQAHPRAALAAPLPSNAPL
ncbi:hypothetical protein JX265_013470 [Neoarthrinium moseri]|uniref:TOM core complex subunit Tom6 n=1 Tax=Neoarthrinium moseri TaxID=1658444 RepID=A0A9P9W8K3_9PEZI|nr:uncharacterized protein JN550_013029 [Neoarthrinium moseri]KAI1841370.1 hypothetical protein JX266_012451 [Neoarthrinium moseri]KAI1850191.1 hypothetical protein JX265_013470 [Neoarthrinium moseri]KAI1857831.1 hypothetical protein JN550_013029 [Neoarthrinium moseri]